MPVNITENLPRQYLRAASSVADAVVDDDDSARLRFAVVDAVATPVALMDCLRLSVVGCGDVDTVLVFLEATLARPAWAPVFAAFSFSLSSESEDETAAIRLLFVRYRENEP
jgi:hypothetical protein